MDFTSNANNIYYFLAEYFMGYLMVAFIFQFKAFHFPAYFLLGQTFRIEENNSVL